MSPIRLVATNTYRQTVRQRLFFNIGVFGVGMIGLSMVMAQVTFGDAARMVRGLGLSGCAIALDLIALLVGVSLIYQEIDKKTLFVVLVRPVRRWQYLVGRFLGLFGALLTALVAFGVLYAIAMSMSYGTFTKQDFIALIAIIPEASIIGAFAILLSAFSTPTLSAGIGLGMWIAATMTDDFVKLTAKGDPMTHQMAKVVSYILPSFARFDFRDAATYGYPIATADVLYTMLYGAAWVVVLLALGSIVLSKREMV